MNRLIHAALALLLLAACSSSAALQERILAPLQTEARLGGSVRNVLRAHPNHQAIGDGAYFFSLTVPDATRRTIRLRGEGDKITWLQIQDEPLAPDPDGEQQRFERELERLENVLGAGRQRGNHLSDSRTAAWNNVDGMSVEWRLEVVAEPLRVRRVWSLSLP
jgi:hypothetical protein